MFFPFEEVSPATIPFLYHDRLLSSLHSPLHPLITRVVLRSAVIYGPFKISPSPLLTCIVLEVRNVAHITVKSPSSALSTLLGTQDNSGNVAWMNEHRRQPGTASKPEECRVGRGLGCGAGAAPPPPASPWTEEDRAGTQGLILMRAHLGLLCFSLNFHFNSSAPAGRAHAPRPAACLSSWPAASSRARGRRAPPDTRSRQPPRIPAVSCCLTRMSQHLLSKLLIL